LFNINWLGCYIGCYTGATGVLQNLKKPFLYRDVFGTRT
jgi:hypothetical protein